MLRISIALLLIASGASADTGSVCRDSVLDWGTSVAIRPYTDQSGAAGCQPRIGNDLSLLAKQIWEGGNHPVGGNKRTVEGETTCLVANHQDSWRALHNYRDARATALGLPAADHTFAFRADIMDIWEADIAASRPVLATTGERLTAFPWECFWTPEESWATVLSEVGGNTPAYAWIYNYGGDTGSDTGCEDASGNAVGCEFVESTVNGTTVDAGGDGLIEELCEQGGGTSCSTAYQRVAYYTQQDDTAHTLWAQQAAVRLDLPQCRAWKLEVLREMMDQGGWDSVEANNKIAQWSWTPIDDDTNPPTNFLSTIKGQTGGADWVGTADLGVYTSVPDGCSGSFADLTAPWSPTTSANAACTYRYTDYSYGTAHWADDLHDAGISYTVHVDEGMSLDSLIDWDDGDPAVDEEDAYWQALYINQANLIVSAKNADPTNADRLSLLETYGGPQRFMIAAQGFPTATRADTACVPSGYSNDGALLLVPYFSSVNTSTKAVVWGPRNTADITPTGNWTGNAYCSCPGVDHDSSPSSLSCTVSDTPGATADGSTDSTTCSSWTSGNTYRLAIDVTQGGQTEWTWRMVTIP